LFLGLLLWVTVGHPYPVYASGQAWWWLALSALVGYVFGDWCLFNCYLSIGARFGQLFMTLAPPMAAIAGWAILGETLSWKSILAMAVTLSGIAISILSRGEGHKVQLTLPFKGVLLGLGAGLGQGVGLVLSKVGLQYYSEAIPADAPKLMADMLPFASTMIRAVVGAMGFLALMALQRGLPRLRTAVRDKIGMRYALIMTLFGPVLGVSLSLMAVQYTNAGIASTLMALTPVFILFPYAFIYKQRIKFREILGVAVSMTGVALFFLL
jgi:drug/metabolite transporter (DMT)-like permease